MAESFYTSAGLPQSPTSPGGPPPPPPPKSEPNTQGQGTRPTSYASPPPIPGHLYAYGQAQTGPQPPPVPPSPSHAQALAQQNARYHSSSTSPPYRSEGYNGSNQQVAQQQNPIPALDSGWLPEGLENKTTADLQPLINNPELLTALAHQHPAYEASTKPLQAAIGANLSMATQVAALEAQVKLLRDQTGQLLINHTSLQTQWRRKQGEMDDALSPWGPRAMYQRLVSSITEQEALLRAMHESFIEGGEGNDGYTDGGSSKATEKEVTDWIKRIREGTTVLEKRREMRARWDEGRVGGWR